MNAAIQSTPDTQPGPVRVPTEQVFTTAWLRAEFQYAQEQATRCLELAAAWQDMADNLKADLAARGEAL